MRRTDNLHLVNFVELQLNSKDNFEQAFDIILKTNIKSYMQKYIFYFQVIGQANSTVGN